MLILLVVVGSLWYLSRRRTTRNTADTIRSQRKLSLDLEDQDEPPPPIPFTTGMPGSGSVSSSRETLIPHPRNQLDRHSAMSVLVLGGSPDWPASDEQKRALHEASLDRIRQVEQKIAEHEGMQDSAESQRLRMEIGVLRAQVEELNAELRKIEEARSGPAYDEPPPCYEPGIERTGVA